jgi:hypothetical protein
MMRYTIFVMIVLGSAASAIASIAPAHITALDAPAANMTVVEKNSPFPVIGPIVVEPCAADDCSDVPSTDGQA